MAPLRVLLALLSSGVLLAAGNPELVEPSVAEARERWEQSSVENYRFFYKLQCFCVGPAAEGVFVTVIGGRVVDVELENTAATTVDFQSFDTIDALFDQISKYDPDTVYSFSAKFDPDLGFPVEFFVDIDHMMADEEWGFIVNGFTIIE